MAEEEKDSPEWVRELPRTSDLVIGTARGVLVRIKPNGVLEYGPDYDPDVAARVFWEAVARHRDGYEEQRLISQHVEAVLVRMGEADLYCEQKRREAAEALGDGAGTDSAVVLEAQRATVVFERVLGQVIELGRGLAGRPLDVKFKDLPGQVPPVVARNPDSSYDPREVPGVNEIGPPKSKYDVS